MIVCCIEYAAQGCLDIAFVFRLSGGRGVWDVVGTKMTGQGYYKYLSCNERKALVDTKTAANNM